MMVYHITALFCLVSHAAAVLLSPSAKSKDKWNWRSSFGKPNEAQPNKYGEFRQTMANYYDAQYTGTISMGGQQVKSIIDTGSFELLVFGVNCSLCGTPKNLYDQSKSKTYSTDGFDKVHSYGSGTTNSVEAVDDLDIGPLSAAGQTFWEVYDANMPILQEDSFASIFGVGPPTSAAKFAEQDAKQIHEQLESLKKAGTEITENMLKIVKSYDDAAKRAWNVTSVVEQLNIHTMSVCMGQESGSDGYYIWNDTAVKRTPDNFLKMETTGDSYWSVDMTDVQLSSAVSKGGKAPKLGCKGGKGGKGGCVAVVDTGTSLIAAPSEVVYQVRDLIGEWEKNGGSCNDLSKLPNLEFSLNGNLLTLPPQSYVGRAKGDFGSFFQNPKGNKKASGKKASGKSDCQLLLMPMDTKQDDKPMWILGMPFFREYYTSFIFKVGKKHFRKQPYAMAFSKATGDCQPGDAPTKENVNLVRETSIVRGAQLNVDASKLLVPALVRYGARIPKDLLLHASSSAK
eukprot:TRINITY_DN998_c0_g1_i2.p1 TRINITY_DN998_c0_g1~~TRINITY_DN998_c0_g1_i2.p1  ORF type:complete len:512 (+),score=107.29 TRINITY_DN998_c0_g1_i2:76-1611(+)